jgi:SagB-type dehydrogenase family enzyme
MKTFPDRSAYRAAPDARSLGLLLELALGLSAWKRLGPDRWALRNNPSSGNLHPTEGYLLLWRQVSEAIPPGRYHYAPHEHALERRARLPEAQAGALARAHPATFGALAFSSIVWREEWKYGARAYRYCQLDVGHALGAARYAAAALGWTLCVDPCPGDRTLAALLGLRLRRREAGS